MFVTYYHNVIPEQPDDLDKRSSRLSLAMFRKQMQFLRHHFHPMSLAHMVSEARQNRLDPKAVAVTFDDAYKGVLRWASPVLEELEIPATVFVVTDTLKHPFGNLHYEEFEIAVRQTAVERIELPELELSPMKLTTLRGKALFLKKVKPLLKSVSEEKRSALHLLILQRLGESAESLVQPAVNQKLSVHELVSMSQSPLWDVGGHTRSHRVLAQLPPREMESEIEGCLQDLQEHLGVSPAFFAYPYGKPSHIGGSAPAIVERAGFQGAFTTESGSLTSQCRTFAMPRVDFLDLMALQSPELQKEARDFFS